MRFRPGTLSDDADGLELLAHELVHIEQQRQLGSVLFYRWYVALWLAGLAAGEGSQSSYLNNPFEIEAYYRAAAIAGMMRASSGSGGRCDGCAQLPSR